MECCYQLEFLELKKVFLRVIASHFYIADNEEEIKNYRKLLFRKNTLSTNYTFQIIRMRGV